MEHKARTKALSWLLSLALMLSLMPGMSLPANAAPPTEDGGGTSTGHVEVGETPHTHNGITFTDWTSTTSLPDTAGSYYLTQDVSLSSTWNVPGTTNLCLNGHGIRYSGDGNASVITVGSGATLNLYDCGTTTTHYITLTDGRGTAVADSGTESETCVVVTGGYITGGNKQSFDDGKCGGGVSVNSGAFTMSGGTIVGNVGYYGGGVCINGNSDHRGAFTMSGGSITGNKAGGGGGVYVWEYNTFTMSDGSISKNVSSSDGGGVRNSGTFTMSGGNITGNTTNSFGSGGGVRNSGTFTMSGGSITGNTTNYTSSDSVNKWLGGGGVHSTGTFTLSGAVTITENKWKDAGSNVCLSTGYKIIIAGALTNTTPIGVMMYNPGVFTSGSTDSLKASDFKEKFASEDSAYSVVADGYELKLASPHTHTIDEEAVSFTAWSTADSLPSTAGSYYLATDVTLAGGHYWNVPAGVTNLCLNGHSITYTGNDGSSGDTPRDDGSMIRIPSGSTLNLYDEGTEPHNYTLDAERYSKLAAQVKDDATGDNVQTFTGGYITGGKAREIINPKGGNFTMNGGTIIGGFTRGVYVSGGTFTMNGGNILGNYYNGVEVDYGSTFTMTGGRISYNIGGAGLSGTGGVYVGSSGTFTMSGGEISHNTAGTESSPGFGGGVFVSGGGTFNLSGNPTIADNTDGASGASNICLRDTDRGVPTIHITDALTYTNPIGVMKVQSQKVQTQSGSTTTYVPIPGVFTSSAASIKAKDYVDKFTSESVYPVEIEGDELRLGTVEPLEAVSYQEATYVDDQVTYTTQTCDDYTVVTSDTTSFEDGKWYVVKDDVTINHRIDAYNINTRITVTGTANLILCDGATLTADSITATNATLNIYGQSAGTGELKAESYVTVGIGCTGGTVNIHGGTVIASGNGRGAGIGGAAGESGADGKDGGTVTIYGGTVTATNTGGGAGIGGGGSYSKNGGIGGTVTIYGGTVRASGGAGIGGGDGEGNSGVGNGGAGGTVTIYGGEVTANGFNGAGIGGGSGKTSGGAGGTVTIYGGTVKANGCVYNTNGSSVGIGGGSSYTGGGKGTDGTLTIGAGVKLETSTDNTNWTDTTSDTSTRTQYMRINASQGQSEGDTPSSDTPSSDTPSSDTPSSDSTPSSSSSSDSSPSTPAATTITVPVSSDTQSVSVTASVSGETATVQKPTTAQLEQIVGESVHTGEVTIDVSGLGKEITTASIPTETVKAVEQAVNDAANDATGMTVKLSEGSVTFDGQALTAITEQATGNNIQLNLDDIGENKLSNTQQAATKDMDVQAVYDAYITSNGQRISDFKGGKATVTVPYELKAEQRAAGVTVWYVADNGEKTEMPSTYDGKDVKFTVEHFSNYVIAYDEERAAVCPQDSTCPISAFTDADPTAWYHDGVHYVLENGIMSGLGNGQFAPNDTTSRAMMAQILWNMEGKPVVNYAMSYTDVDGEAWYTEAVRWATSEKIMEGYGGSEAGSFGPNDAITREQLVTIMYRYAQMKKVDVSIGEDTNILSYDDALQVSEWAIPAMQWAVGAEIVNGTSASTLSPKNNASRAEIATIVMRYCEKNAK